MPRRDWPDYSVTEYVLCGLFMGIAVICFIYAGYAWANDAPFDALEAGGGGLLLLGGCVDPVGYVVDTLTFPWRESDPAGRDTWVTRSAAGLGLAMGIVGFVGNWLS